MVCRPMFPEGANQIELHIYNFATSLHDHARHVHKFTKDKFIGISADVRPNKTDQSQPLAICP